jgi:Asp-tRNA(Asn)/Glu-tRNA(Gln) amidotransferase A subunit family amidase
MEILDLTIREAASRLERREISSLDLVEATLRRIEVTEPLIHAYALVLAEEAREAARAADAEMADGYYRGPPHGIPIGVKDLCYTQGIPTEAGSRALAGFVPSYDAAVVERLHDAGAVIVGKTVTHELAYGVNVPPTRNAWDPTCYPGGSSAGSGAAVAARSALGAIGTDTGGSIREPAALNGLVGLKPTFGLVSRYGIVPLSPSLDHAGPLTRTVEDCALLLQALAGYDSRDSGSIDQAPADYTASLEEGAAGLTVGVEWDQFMGSAVQPEVRRAVEAVLAEFAAQGVTVVELKIPELALVRTVGLTIMLPDASAQHWHLLRERGSDLDPATRLMLELGQLVPAAHYALAQRARRVLCDAMRRAFQAYRLTALVSPTSPGVTVPMDEMVPQDETGEDPLAAGLDFMMPANITGQPALSVPCGFSASGLPIGVQFFGRPFDEATLLRLARAYERNHEWAARSPELAGQ